MFQKFEPKKKSLDKPTASHLAGTKHQSHLEFVLKVLQILRNFNILLFLCSALAYSQCGNTPQLPPVHLWRVQLKSKLNHVRTDILWQGNCLLGSNTWPVVSNEIVHKK